MELDVVLQVALWLQPKDTKKYLGCLSRTLTYRLQKQADNSNQEFWRQLTLNQVVRANDLVDNQVNCWKRLYGSLLKYPHFITCQEKLPKVKKVLALLAQSVFGMFYHRTPLVLLDLRIAQEDILQLVSRVIGNIGVKCGVAIYRRSHYLTYMLTTLITDRRVDTYSWLRQECGKVTQFRSSGCLMTLLRSPRLKNRLTTVELSELVELLQVY